MRPCLFVIVISLAGGAAAALAQSARDVVQAPAPQIEVSYDGHETVVVQPSDADGHVTTRGSDVPYGAAPDWQNNLRRQVGALQVADMNNDGWNDVVVGCYISQSFPPYDVWRNYIYYNTGAGELEANPSWISDDEVSTGDVQVGYINDDEYLDIFAANGGASMSPSVIYFGGPNGPSTTPGWVSAEPAGAWNNYAVLFDLDHDGDLDVVTANQGNSQFDPFRPMFLFRNTNGVLETVPSWQSSESCIQNFLAFADYDGDGWEELAVSRWTNGFHSGIYENNMGSLSGLPTWTTGFSDTDKGVAWADVDGNDWPDLALGHDPTFMYSNDAGVLTHTWTSTATFHGHSDLRFHDVNRDGRPDLVETHFSDGKTHVYLNRNGALDAFPSWTYDSPTVGTAIALGDITGDGWDDLVVGNSGDPSVKVFYAQPPPCPADLNGDGDVDLVDLSITLSNFGSSGADPEDGDLDGDGDVDLTDLSTLLSLFGTTC